MHALLYKTEYLGETGKQGLKRWIKEIDSKYNDTCEGYGNEHTQQILYYCYSYLCSGPTDWENISKGLEKDGMPSLLSTPEDTDANFYTICLAYRNTTINGRPLYGLRVLQH